MAGIIVMKERHENPQTEKKKLATSNTRA